MVVSLEKFIIDANALITPYHSYYAFDIAPSFWDKMALAFERKQIVLLDKIKDELLVGDDSLTRWIKENKDKIEVCNYKNKSVIYNYQSILQYVQMCGLYKEDALKEWAPSNVADPWLIAAAMSYNYTIVTLEASSGGLSKKTPNKHAKIPDVAHAFGVKTISLFEMMKKLEITL